ncbi:MAG: phosphatase PAP2 family protein [Bacteriovoracaceae bacterium]|jgi:undecaprenyl-diphosphatase|nr:phosphatase PAP2 family protein [Bacteriovoracaceae bacterium]
MNYLLQKLLEHDITITLFLNSLHNKYIDPIMLFVSNSHIPLYFFLCLFFFKGLKYYSKKIYVAFLFMILAFAASDLISTKGLKNNTKRLRPCHNTHINKQLHTAGNKCGGKYSFVSSHAANSFTLVTFIWLLFKSFSGNYKYFFIYSTLVSYSRIYLGRHFLLDIICGSVLGILIAYFINYLYRKLMTKLS